MESNFISLPHVVTGSIQNKSKTEPVAQPIETTPPSLESKTAPLRERAKPHRRQKARAEKTQMERRSIQVIPPEPNLAENTLRIHVPSKPSSASGGELEEQGAALRRAVWAAFGGSAIELERLVQAGLFYPLQDSRMDMNPDGSDKKTMLMYAAGGRLDTLVSLLIRAGIDVSAKDAEGQTALHYAAKSGTPDSIEMLLQARADINVTDNQGWTPLMFAVKNVDEPMVMQLLAAGAQTTSRLKSAYDLAAEHACFSPACMQALDPKRALKLKPEEVEEEEQVSSSEGEEVSDTDSSEKPDQSQAVRAAAYEAFQGSFEHLAQLVRSGLPPLQDRRMDMRSNSKYQQTMLMYAAASQNQRLAGLLLQAGVDISARDAEGRTAMHYAVISGDIGTLEVLLQAGAEVDVAEKDGWTPLMFAAQNGDEPMIMRLIDAGADVTAMQSDGKTAYRLAADSQLSKPCMKALLGNQDTVSPPPSRAKSERHRNWSNILIISPFSTIQGINPVDESAPASKYLEKIKRKYPGKDVYVIKAKPENAYLKNPTKTDLAKLRKLDVNTKVYILGHSLAGADNVSENEDDSGCLLTADAIATFFATNAAQLKRNAQALTVRVMACQSASHLKKSRDFLAKTHSAPSFCERLCTALYRERIQPVVRGYVENVFFLPEGNTRRTMSHSPLLPQVGGLKWGAYHRSFSRKEFIISAEERCIQSFIDYPITPQEEDEALNYFKKEIERVSRLNPSTRTTDIKRENALLATGQAPPIVNADSREFELRFLDHPHVLIRYLALLDGCSPSVKDYFLTNISLQIFRLAHKHPEVVQMAIQYIQHPSIVACLKNFPALQTPEMLKEYYKVNPFFIALLPRYLQDDALFLEAVKRNGEVLNYRPEYLHDAKMLDIAIDSNKGIIATISDLPLLLGLLQRRPELLSDIALHLIENRFQFEAYQEVLTFFPEGIMQAFYTRYPDLLFACLEQLGKTGKRLPQEFFSIGFRSEFWKDPKLQALLQAYPAIFSLFCKEPASSLKLHETKAADQADTSAPVVAKEQRLDNAFFQGLFGHLRHDPRLIAYIPNSLWENATFQQGFLELITDNPRALLYPFSSYSNISEKAKDAQVVAQLCQTSSEFFMKCNADFLEKADWTNPVFFQEALGSCLSDILVKINAIPIITKEPALFPLMPESVRAMPEVALIAVRHNGLFLQHVPIPTRMNQDVVQAALTSHPDAWKHTV